MTGCHVPGGWGVRDVGTPCSEQYGEALPKNGAFFVLTAYERVEKFSVLVCKRVIKVHLQLTGVAYNTHINYTKAWSL